MYGGELIAFEAALAKLTEGGRLIGHQCDNSEPDSESIEGERLAFEIVWRAAVAYGRRNPEE